jgi:hypothetical protein
VAKGISEAEHSDLQRLWGCNRLDSAILQKGSEASSRFFEVGGCPFKTGSNPIFDKKSFKGQRTLQVHSSIFDKEKERNKTTVFFKFLTALVLLEIILTL